MLFNSLTLNYNNSSIYIYCVNVTPFGTSNRTSCVDGLAIILSILAHVMSPVFILLKPADSLRAPDIIESTRCLFPDVEVFIYSAIIYSLGINI